MKTLNLIKLMTFPILIGLMLCLSYCKKETKIVKEIIHDTTIVTIRDTINRYLTVLVHDTIKGKAIIGNITYPDPVGTPAIASGAVVMLYMGSAQDPAKLVAMTFADATGNYKFPYLLPNAYFIFSKYNTDNQNYKMLSGLNGVNFASIPGYAVTLGTTDLTQNITLVNYAATGNIKISLDTSVNLFRKVTLDKAHSRIAFETEYGPASQGALFPGFFGSPSGIPSQTAFNLTKFAFDEANPSNTVIEGYVLLHERTTGEDGRDALGQCGSKALLIDTAGMGGAIARPETDTCKLISTSVVKYGKGYMCRAILRGFLMHKGPGNNDPICPTCPADTVFGFTGPFDVPRDFPVNMYFEFGGKQYVAGTNWYYLFPFEGTFTFNKRTMNINHASIGDNIKVSCHVNIRGASKTPF
ncbi:MAG: hypothetical protein Q8M15_06445 [Bacteroidota bacterium]|nr:hypothetical protein [Bacteroidota bacterium]